MTKPSFSRICRLLPALLAIVIAGCGNSDGKSGPAHIRLLNLSTGYASVDVFTNNADSDTDTQQISAVAFESISTYATVKADEYFLKFRKAGVGSDLYSTGTSLTSGSYATLVAVGATNHFQAINLRENVDDPSSGYAKVQILNLAGTGGMDLYLTESTEDINDLAPTISSASSGTVATKRSGTYRMRILATGTKTDLRLDVPAIALDSASVVTIILTATDGGTLVNAVLLPQKGQPTFYQNSESAHLRVLNLSTGYDSLDLYASTATDDTERELFTGLARETASPYSSITADTYSLNFRKSGVSADLTSLIATMPANSYATYVAYGTLNNFSLMTIQEDADTPDSGYTKLQVLNTTSSDTLDIYLTGPTDSLDDVSPAIKGVQPGVQTVFVTLRSGSYRLRITSADKKSDVRLDVPAFMLTSGVTGSLILSETGGGVLVDTVLLPQRDDATVYSNANARVRGAIGLSTGSAVTVSVAGTDILTSRPARSYIADSYTNLAAGNAQVSVYVDGVNVVSGVRTLEPGMDYTVLVTDIGGVPQINLIADANHAARQGYAKLRLINGMAGLAAPLNLSADYAPVAEYVDLGTASGYAEVAAGSDIQLDVSNAESLATLLTRESITLQDRGVYTFFSAGGGTSAVAGTLRRDR